MQIGMKKKTTVDTLSILTINRADYQLYIKYCTSKEYINLILKE